VIDQSLIDLIKKYEDEKEVAWILELNQLGSLEQL
jgi:hypothetical protein